MKASSNIAVVLFLALVIIGCAAPQPRQGSPSSMQGPLESHIKVEPEARALYYQAERAFLAKRYEAAEDGFRNVKNRFPRGKAHLLASYRLGMTYYYEANYPDASQEFMSFLSRYSKSELAFDVTYNLAASEYQQGNYERANQVLARLRPSEVQAQGPRRAEVVYQLAGQVAASMGNHPAAVVAYAAQMQLPMDESLRDRIAANINDQLSRISERDKLERLLTQVTEPMTRARIRDRLTNLVAVQEQAAAANGAVSSAIIPAAIPTAEENTGEAPAAGLVSGGSGDSTNIGIVLPLSGKSANYGRKALEGILLASGVFSRQHPGSFRLFVEDSASNPAIAAQAVEQLYNKQRVMAIIGPISWKESVAVAEKAQELGVLNLSLTTREGISEMGPYLFQNALTPGVQLENLVRYVVSERHFRRFAILAPKNTFGDVMANRFWDLVEKNGGHVVGYEIYPPDEKDFQTYIKSLVGLTDTRDRRMEVERLAQYVKEVKDKTGKEPKSPRLPPIVDFDGIFIPDSPKVVGQISASLAYFDVKGATLLGTTEWNSDQLYQRGGRYVEGAIFPGGINFGTRNPRQREFIKQFADAYGEPPDLLASQSYEAMQIVATALGESGSGDRNALVKEMAGLKDFQGPLGTLAFDSARLARRALPVFALEPGGNIVEQ